MIYQFIRRLAFMSVFAASLGAAAPSFAGLPEQQYVAPPVNFDFLFESRGPGALDDRYRIGDEWGKKPVTRESLGRESRAFQRAAQATARIGGGTAFYLGTFAGYHVMATNHHVMPRPAKCSGSAARFPLLGLVGTCSVFFGTWPEIDLTLFALAVEDEGVMPRLEAVAGNFDFSRVPELGETLLTVGFGLANNPDRELVANQDSDCRVLSRTAEFRLMADPDSFNPGPYRAWSFSNGCDVSHGDSGSAMVDRESSRVVGIIWTGKIPKSPGAQSSRAIEAAVAAQSEEIWTEYSYAVPALKMAEVLRGALASPELSAPAREVIAALLR